MVGSVDTTSGLVTAIQNKTLLEYLDLKITSDQFAELLDETSRVLSQPAMPDDVVQLTGEVRRFLHSYRSVVTAYPGEWMAQAANAPKSTRYVWPSDR